MTGGRSFRVDELGDAPARELQAALEAAAWLDASIDDVPGISGAGLADRVMAAIAAEPAPAAIGFLGPLGARGLVGGFWQSVRQAWAAVGTPGRPLPGRAAALAYVLAIAVAGLSLAGATTLGVGSALGLFGPGPTQTPPLVSPAPTLEPAPSPSIAPSPSAVVPPPTPGPSASPTESAEPSDDHGGGGGPGSEPSDDHGGNSGPGSTDDGGSSGSGSGSGSSGSGGGTDDSSGSGVSGSGRDGSG